MNVTTKVPSLSVNPHLELSVIYELVKDQQTKEYKDFVLPEKTPKLGKVKQAIAIAKLI